MIYPELLYKTQNPIEVGFIVDGYGNFRVEWREG
jgi:hypothetical protein